MVQWRVKHSERWLQLELQECYPQQFLCLYPFCSGEREAAESRFSKKAADLAGLGGDLMHPEEGIPGNLFGRVKTFPGLESPMIPRPEKLEIV